MQGVTGFLKELFIYQGRIGRWRLMLNYMVAIGGTYAILFLIGLTVETIWPGSIKEVFRSEDFSFFIQLVHIIMIIPLIFSLIKRLHDMDYPSGLLLLGLLPVINLILLLIILFKKGTAGPNKYGEDPLK